MKKIASICIVGILVLTGFGAVALSDNNIEDKDEFVISKTYQLGMSEPAFVAKGDFISLQFEQESFLAEPCKPLVPRVGETFTYPYGTHIESVSVDIQTRPITLPAKITPAPTPAILGSSPEESDCGCTEPFAMDEETYLSTELYPSEQYRVTKDIGLSNGEVSVIVNVQCYAQYIPAEDILYLPEEISITIDYTPSEIPSPNDDDLSVYDMLIITHPNFESEFQRLVNHKNSVGVRTVMETTDEIYDRYEGKMLEYGDQDDTARAFNDEAEMIKYRLFEAFNEWGIRYAILAGGHYGQTRDWWVPSRRVHCDDDSDHEMGFESQTYFMDIIQYDQYGFPVFSCWDPNRNGVYGESGEFMDLSDWDIIAMYPDIVVGRIPFRYSWEPKGAVDKIIGYETQASPDSEWFRHGVAFAGDTSPVERYPEAALPNIPEGAHTVNYALEQLESIGWKATRVFPFPVGDYGCDVTLTQPDDLTNVINENGAGLLYLSGHSSPLAHGDYPIDIAKYKPSVTIFTIRKYNNGYKLPIGLMSGCSTARFNVTSQDIIEQVVNNNIDKYNLAYYMPIDISSYMMLHPNGGVIADVGYSGLGYGYLNCVDCENLGLSQFQNTRVAYLYAQGFSDIFGDLYAEVVTQCIDQVGEYQEDINRDVVDRKHVQEWVYLGDPSLKIGGYGLALMNEEENDTPTEQTNSLATENVPTWNVGDSWTYKLNDVDIVLSEVEGRDFDIKLSAGDITITVDEVTQQSYITSIQTQNVDVKLDIDFDFRMEGKDPIALAVEVEDVAITGALIFEKSTLAIKQIDLDLALELDLATLPIELPQIVTRFVSSIPLDVALTIDFDPGFYIIEFPLAVGTNYSLHGTAVSIDGEISSVYFRLAAFLNKITSIFGIDLIPPSLAKYLPVIDISEFMQDNGMPTGFYIDEMRNFYRLAPFEVFQQTTVSVPAGTYTGAYQIDILGGLATMYYAPQENTLVKFEGYVGDFIPYLENINVELIS